MVMYGDWFPCATKAGDTPRFLDIGGKYSIAKLTLVIFRDVRKLFKNDPERFYEG